MNRLETYQEEYKKYYNLSTADIEAIASQLPHPKYLDFVYNRFDYMPSINNFSTESYNNIKADDWPDCTCLEDFKDLPQHIVDECRDVHGFDIHIRTGQDIDKDKWQNYKGGVWPISELLKYKYTVLDLKEYIAGKNLVDFACHAGLTSLACLHNGAKSAVATNVRPEFVDIANECLGLSEFSNNFTAVVADINDYDLNTQLCLGKDCVLLYGILYHVHDSFKIIESIAKANPTHIIIDTVNNKSIMDLPIPLVSYYTEDTESCWNGWYNNYNTVFVGMPNETWFHKAMKFFGYRVVKQQRYNCGIVGSFDVDKSPNKVVLVYEK